MAAGLALSTLLAVSPASAAPLAPHENAAFNRWLAIVQARLTRSARRDRNFPRSARITVGFIVHHDGTISGSHVVAADDPDPSFATLALRAVERAGPFPPMPASYHHERVPIAVPLHFHVLPPRKGAPPRLR